MNLQSVEVTKSDTNGVMRRYRTTHSPTTSPATIERDREKHTHTYKSIHTGMHAYIREEGDREETTQRVNDTHIHPYIREEGDRDREMRVNHTLTHNTYTHTHPYIREGDREETIQRERVPFPASIILLLINTLPMCVCVSLTSRFPASQRRGGRRGGRRGSAH